MTNQNHFGSFVLLLFSLTLLDATDILIREVGCNSNADYVKVFIKIHNGTDKVRSSAVDIDATVFQDVPDNVLVSLDLASKMGNEYRTLLSSTVDMCSLNVSKSNDPLMRLLVSEMNKYGNLTVDCPLHSGNYVVRNFRINRENLLIKMAPPGQYRVGIDVKHKKVPSNPAIPIFDIEFYADLIANK
ncbi:uncharacterized protein LOC131436707 [Malaya genurostris]|uniref:uncharacterized protein LOC131436707 n=1 Tax=Malaya genurostris TaxID=325434 RepID=UPI0026F39F5E|nr:uncharacterized protein LOC131436707 [Malaya genurostris]